MRKRHRVILHAHGRWRDRNIVRHEKQRVSSKNHFQSIHAELHRRYKAKSYSLIRVEQYAAVLAFLEEWDEAMEAGGEDSGENA